MTNKQKILKLIDTSLQDHEKYIKERWSFTHDDGRGNEMNIGNYTIDDLLDYEPMDEYESISYESGYIQGLRDALALITN